jgi:hypothetical protein
MSCGLLCKKNHISIVYLLLVVIGVFLDSSGLSNDQTFFCRTIDEGGLQWVCNHRVQASVLADAILIEVRAQSVLGNAFVHGKTGIWTPPKIFKNKAKTQCRG